MRKESGIIGWDIGGAHVKLARLSAGGRMLAVEQHPCALWEGIARLDTLLGNMGTRIEFASHRHAVTMTGELVDSFPDRRRGVRALLGCARRRFATRQIRVYALGRGLRSIQYAQTHPYEVASANWHATATIVARLVPSALLVDIGSTTTDITPIHRYRIEVCGDSDGERMAHGELVYTGVVRTPLMAVVSQLPFAGRWQGVAAEWFVTTGDVYLLTGQLPRRYYQSVTADGRGLTSGECMRRLARMLGRDAVEGTPAQWITLAHHIAGVHLHSLRGAIERVLSRCPDNSANRIIGAGCGRFVVREIARQMHYPYVDIGELLRVSPTLRDIAAVCAPAVAVARLAER